MKTRLICVGVNTVNSYYRNVLRGIISYLHQRPGWQLTFVRPQLVASTRKVLKEADGAIVCVNDVEWCQYLLKTRIPLINVDAVIPNLPVPRVNVDNKLVGKIVAEHFLERGLTSFGFVGQKSLLFSVDRENAYRNALAARGHSLAVYESPSKEALGPLGYLHSPEIDLANWLTTLQRPVGIMTPYDLWGAELIETCRQLALRVPEDVAIVGVDNDELYCSVTEPPLSSVVLPAVSVGFEAGRQLDRLIDERRTGLTEDILLPPVGLIARKSSDFLAVADDEVRVALAFVRDNFQLRIQVSDVVHALGVSRRSLERKTIEAIGISLGSLIRRHRLEHAKQLLIETDLSVAQVASRSGYGDSRRIEFAFAQVLGRTPTEFRRESKAVNTAWSKAGDNAL